MRDQLPYHRGKFYVSRKNSRGGLWIEAKTVERVEGEGERESFVEVMPGAGEWF